MTRPLVYGAYGYTGRLVARELAAAGRDPILAGRRADPLRAVARELDVDSRVASLDDLRETLAETATTVCVHCAGPFVDTYRPAVEACLATETDYVDVTGEIPVFEALRAYDERAHTAGVTILPGAGFDVVPSDYLSARLAAALPDATRLTLAFEGLGGVSPGTARTAARLLGEGATIRVDGRLRSVPFGSRVRTIDTGTGAGPRRMGVFPWGDVSTAHHTTGIGTIEVYAANALGLPIAGQRLLGRLQPVFRAGSVRRALVALADRLADGPDERRRETGSAYFWGEVTDGDRTVTGRVHTPEPYRFTASAVAEIAGRLIDGDAPSGFRTPADAYGHELVTAVDDARFEAVGPVE